MSDTTQAMPLAEELDHLEFRDRVRELREAGRLSAEAERAIAGMEEDSIDLREFKARMHYGGIRLMAAAEYRYLSSALEQAGSRGPETWAQSQAWVRAFGVDQYASTQTMHRIEQERTRTAAQEIAHPH